MWMVVGTVDVYSREGRHKLELFAKLEAHIGSHVVATNALRVVVLDSGGGMGGADSGEEMAAVLERWVRWLELTQLPVYLYTYMQKL